MSLLDRTSTQRAIRVYLDSSDYSVMSEPNNAEVAEIRSKLLSYIESSVIEVRFSAVHLVECAHLDDASKPMALRRTEVIVDRLVLLSKKEARAAEVA